MIPMFHKTRNAIWQSLSLALLGAVLAAPAASAGCAAGPTRLCLLGRFAVEASWWNGGDFERVALAVPLASSGAGAFSFFGSENGDLLVRVVQERRGDGHFTVEAGAAAGAPFELHVLDTVTGVEQTHRNPRGQISAFRAPFGLAAPGEVDGAAAEGGLGSTASDVAVASAAGWTVADFLEAGEAGRLAAEPVATPDGCLGSATDLCLLGGRLLVRTRFNSEDHSSEARAARGGGETGFFSATERGAAEVAVRVVDGRAVNGNFWLLYSALSEGEVEIEIVDLASGNRRQFVKPAGSPASVAEIEALSASAAVVSVTLDQARAVTKQIGALGGVLETTDARGTRFRFVVPKSSLLSTLDLKLTPVATIGNLPFSGGLTAAVYIEPAGFVMSESALLTITPNPVLLPAQQLTFGFRGLAGELALTPPLAGQTALVLPVHRLGGFGVGAGTAADLTAQLGRLPTNPDDRFLQQLAGLVLPPRRAGNATSPLPPTVLQRLQQDFTARIRPKLLAMKLGNLDPNYPGERNWRNAAKETGQAAKLAAQFLEIKSAEIAGARKSYELASKSGTAAPARACHGPKAAGRMYRAYGLLKSHGAQRQVKEDALLRCARFELTFDTVLWSLTGAGVTVHDEVQVKVPLLLNIATGTFLGGKQVEQRVAAANSPSGCTTTKTGSVVNSSLKVPSLFVPSFLWQEDLDSPVFSPPALRYRIEPPSKVGWRLKCPGPPEVNIGFESTWSGVYTLFHLEDLDASRGEFVEVLDELSEDTRIYARKEYLRAPLPFHTESTVFILVFAPVT